MLAHIPRDDVFHLDHVADGHRAGRAVPVHDRRRIQEQLKSLDPRGDDGFLLLDLEIVIVLADVAEGAGVSQPLWGFDLKLMPEPGELSTD